MGDVQTIDNRVIVEFSVSGEPRPKGSMRAFVINGKPRITNNDKNTKPWQDLVKMMSQFEAPDEPFAGPVSVTLEFVIRRPKAHYGTGRNAEKLKDSAPTRPAKKPDIDKLARTVLDAMSAIVFVDDAQVVQLDTAKVFGNAPGVHVRVAECY